MSAYQKNPWVERFNPPVDADEIRRRVAVGPRPFSECERLSPDLASREFRGRLKEVFFPSTQCVKILAEWMGLALGHCQGHYHGRRDFLATLYGEKIPFPSFSFPMCLTGLSGIGKSKLLEALGRLMPPASSVTADDETKFRLVSYRMLTVQASGSATDILVELTGQKSGTRALTDIARKRAYRDGWAFLGVDELQFLTQSDKANTRLVQVLLLVGYVGIPVVYNSNFSMLHKLLRRNQEDRQRLLGNVWVLFPEQPNSFDWVSMLEWHKRIAPDVLDFDAKTDAEAIHRFTGGINRAENHLLEVAFRRALESGRPVRLRELEAAYKSERYNFFRKDIELLSKLPYSGALQKANKDLWCPFDISPRVDLEETLAARRQERVGEAAILASLNATERAALKALTRNATTKQKQKKKAAQTAPSPTKTSLADQLKEDSKWFEDNN